MEKTNDLIFDSLLEIEKKAKEVIITDLKDSQNEAYNSFYNLWERQNREEHDNLMIEELKNNIEKYWLAEKYNSDIDKSFNMIYFEHGGLYGGELEAFAVDFNDSGRKISELEIDDNQMEYLDTISCLPAFLSPTLYHLTEKIQGEEDNFDDFLDVNNIYELFEATALIEMNKLFKRADKEKVFQKLNLKKPFYLAVAEHDAGTPKLIYVIE
ncbi:hypothetical protein [Flavobacterium sp. KACC 22763]|uniref:hypothetical protein n=1 Tax=Flavobacterium sp. KACC 22763 TaxID=3025668 RepID=UPI002365EFA7|nr:hypothetical protein [Flavobacterium sp. KACC 22763]WDF63201.1 hypothetical protein PQ463_16465 [Flavobacterium sp. KACC 22763]